MRMKVKDLEKKMLQRAAAPFEQFRMALHVTPDSFDQVTAFWEFEGRRLTPHDTIETFMRTVADIFVMMPSDVEFRDSK